MKNQPYVLPIRALIGALRDRGDRELAAGVAACERLARQQVPLHGLSLIDADIMGVERIGVQHFGTRTERRAFTRVVAQHVCSKDAKAADHISDAFNAVLSAETHVYYWMGIATALIYCEGNGVPSDWAELGDARQDIYTLQDGEPVNRAVRQKRSAKPRRPHR